jgi:chromosome segregation ATPase
MSDSSQNSNGQEATPPAGSGPERKPAALDRAFPPLWVMGGLIFIVILAVMVMGWKVVNLEKEQWALDNDRKELKDLWLRFEGLTEAVQELEEKHDPLKQSVIRLRGEAKTMQLRLGKVATKLRDAKEKYDEATAGKERAKKDEKMAGDRAAELNAQVVDWGSRVKQLQQQEKELRSLLDVRGRKNEKLISENREQEQRKQKLEMEIQNQKIKIKNRKETLDSLIQDQGDLVQLSKGFQDVLDKLNISGDKARTSVGSLAQGVDRLSEVTKNVKVQSSELAKSAQVLDQETATLKASVQKLDSGKDALTTTVQVLSDEAHKVQGAADNLQTASTKSSKAANFFRNVAQNVSTQLQQLAKDAEAQGREMASSTGQFASHSTEMGRNLEDVKRQVSSLEDMVRNLRSIVEGMSRPTKTLPETIQSLEASGGELTDQMARLKNGLNSFHQAAETLKREANTIRDTTASASDLVVSMSGQPKRLDGLMKDLDGLRTTLLRLAESLRQAADNPAPIPKSKPTSDLGPGNAPADDTPSAEPSSPTQPQ